MNGIKGYIFNIFIDIIWGLVNKLRRFEFFNKEWCRVLGSRRVLG